MPVSARAWRGHNAMLASRHGPPVLFDGDPGLGPSGWTAREHRDMTIRLRHFGYSRM